MLSSRQRPLFSYATEDFRLLPRAFAPKHLERVMCICSGGETMLNLLMFGARHVSVVDNSSSQLALARLKLAGLYELPLDVYRALLGVSNKHKAKDAYGQIKARLSIEDQSYWGDGAYLKDGALWCGSLSRFLTLTGRILRITLGRQRMQRLLQLKSSDDAEAFVDSLFRLWRFQITARFLLSPPVLKRFYPDCGWRSLSEQETPKSFCLSKLKGLIANETVAENPIVRPFLFGDFPESLWPPYVTPSQVERDSIRSSEVCFHEKDVREFPMSHRGQPFTAFVLCNILDWLSIEEMRKFLESLESIVTSGARLLMYSRTHTVTDVVRFNSNRWHFDFQESESLTRSDRTGYHNGVFLLTAS